MYCVREFSGGATRITEHLLARKGGMKACTKSPGTVKAALQAKARAAQEAKATKDRLAGATAADLSPSLSLFIAPFPLVLAGTAKPVPFRQTSPDPRTIIYFLIMGGR